MPYQQIQRNRPVATLIKWYIDKKSGKVSEARKEIQRRFDYLDWKDQKRIILAFLNAGKNDRAWAYSKVYRQWDDCYLEPMKRLWEQYHEDKCTWSVTEHFPIDYIKENAPIIEEISGYYHICKRLAENPSYCIDRTKLQDKEYLLVMLHAHRKVSEEEARDIFFRYLHKVCLTEPEDLLRVNHESRGYAFSVDDIDLMKSLLWLFHLLGLENLRYSIYEWNQDVMSAIYQSDEFKLLNQESVNENEYNLKRLAIGLKYLYIALETKYKQPADKPYIDHLFEEVESQNVKVDLKESQKPVSTPLTGKQREKALRILEQMKAGNPSIEKLVNLMDLDFVADTCLGDGHQAVGAE